MLTCDRQSYRFHRSPPPLTLRTGINLVASLEQDEWRAKNRRFKRDLEEQLGPEELKHFKVPNLNQLGGLRKGKGLTGIVTVVTCGFRLG